MNCFNIRDFGSVGNGIDFDAPAIQQALDAAAAAGGGTVVVPPGTYLAADIKLRDNVTLYLENGSRIKGAEKIDLYTADNTVNQNSQHHYLICGRGVKNVVIEGAGTIDGSGESFWSDEFCNATARRPKGPRPTMIYCIDCENITVRNVRIENASVYTVWFLGCRDVQIDGVTIRNDRQGPNTDALDIDCCSNVRISNCDIVAGDDCIAVKSDIYRLGREAVCENVVVSNCIFSSSTCAIRIGYEGDGVIRDCIFSNLICCNCAKVIAMQSLVPEKVAYTEIKKGTVIENMLFANFVLRNVDRAFFIRAGSDEGVPGYQAHIRDVFISNIQGTVKKESFIGSTDDFHINRIFMENIHLSFMGELSGCSGAVPGVWGHNLFPAAPLAFRYVANLKVSDMSWDYNGNAVIWEKVADGSFNGAAME